jgi:hypothetical protein
MMAEPWPEGVEWVRSNTLEHVIAPYETEAGETAWMEATLELFDEDETIHFHVEFSIEKPDTDDVVELPAPDIVKKITTFLSQGSEQEGFAQSHAVIEVPRKEIPENGLVAKLLNFHQQSCGAKLSLAGATLTMDDEAFTKMKFAQRNESDDICVELWAEGFAEIDEGLISSFFDLLSTGFDCFAFERLSREQPSTK